MADKKENKNRIDSSTAAGISGALGAGLGGYIEKDNIKKSFENKKNPVKHIDHMYNEATKEQKARKKFAEPITKDLEEKKKTAKTPSEKKKLYSDAQKKMDGFKHTQTPYKKNIGESAIKRFARGAKSLKTAGKFGATTAGLTALSEYGKGWQ